jgi:hypothetical protein
MTNSSGLSTVGDCASVTKSPPACADPAWQLYKAEVGYFCCDPSLQGVLVGPAGDKGPLCVAAVHSVAATDRASKVW